jgi:hypothetical protein
VTVIAEETGVFVVLPDVIRNEVESVGHDFPIRNQGGHIVVDGDVGIFVDRAPHGREVPSPVVAIVFDLTEVEGDRRGHHEEVPLPRVFIDIPVGRLGKEQTIITGGPDEVILVRRPRVQQLHRPVGVDMEDGHVGFRGRPVVQANTIASLQQRLFSPVHPDPRLQRITGLLVLRVGGTEPHDGERQQDPNVSTAHDDPRIHNSTLPGGAGAVPGPEPNGSKGLSRGSSLSGDTRRPWEDTPPVECRRCLR